MSALTILAGDIGATNCRFALFRYVPQGPQGAELSLLRERWLPGARYASFALALEALLQADGSGGQGPFLEGPGMVDLAVLAPAGPIENDTCRISNLPWVIRAGDAAATLGASTVFLINDFAAQGYACLLPDRLDLVSVQNGIPVPGSPVAVIGGGTGLGKALLLPARPSSDAEPPLISASGHSEQADTAILPHPGLLTGVRVLPTEGGHAQFPFAPGEECEFAAFILRETGLDQVIGDMVVTGSGLGHVYAFLTGERLPDKEVPPRLAAAPKALEWFARFYARACRDFILETLSLGGLYITGGMALRAPVLSHPAFMREFLRNASQRRLLENLPIRHIRSQQAGLWGAALYGVLRSL